VQQVDAFRPQDPCAYLCRDGQLPRSAGGALFGPWWGLAGLVLSGL